MTEEEKAKRRIHIQDQAQAKRSAKELTYWLTRDRDADGVLEKHIDVWLSRPRLCPLPGGVGVTWVCDDILVETAGGDCPARYAQWTTDQCLRACRVYPETERECIRIGE
jgi:hypothetical protein